MRSSSIIWGIASIALLSSLSIAQDSGKTSPLSQAIGKFNAQSLQNRIGKDQPPLTEDEVVAAIRLADRADYPVVSDGLFATYKNIVQTRQLPPGAEFEYLDQLDRGGDFIFNVWYVRIRIPKEDYGSFAFTIRNRVIRARPVGEVADELERELKDIPPLPGRYRIEDRVRDLKARAAAVQSKANMGSIPNP